MRASLPITMGGYPEVELSSESTLWHRAEHECLMREDRCYVFYHRVCGACTNRNRQ
jgi:hypothetical protein